MKEDHEKKSYAVKETTIELPQGPLWNILTRGVFLAIPLLFLLGFVSTVFIALENYHLIMNIAMAPVAAFFAYGAYVMIYVFWYPMETKEFTDEELEEYLTSRLDDDDNSDSPAAGGD